MSDINKEYDNLLKSADEVSLSATLTDEQVETVNKILEDNVENSEELKMIKDLPSNNDIETNNDNETGELKIANTILDPNTGESKIISTEDFDEVSPNAIDKAFQSLLDREINKAFEK